MSELPGDLAHAFRRLSVDVADALAEITIPAFVLSRGGEIRWVNAAAVEAFGDRRGEHYSTVVAQESRGSVAAEFSRKIRGGSRATSYEAQMLGRDGRRYLAEIDSVRLEDHGHVIGVFGVIDLERALDDGAARTTHLTPRQLEVLQLLAGGWSTDQISERLSISRETVRNHVRGVLRALGVHSRLEAVARARALGVV